MKKLFILICLTFLLAGCTADYQVKIKNGKIYEKLVLIETDKSIFDVPTDSGWTVRETFDVLKEKDEFSKQNYTVKSLDNSDRLGIEYKSNEFNSMINSSILNQCYTNFSVSEENNIITIDTGDQFDCYNYYKNLNSVRVELTTNHKVYSSNADEVKNNKYIWSISESGNKRITISYSKDPVKNNTLNIVVILSVLILVSVISYYVIKKNKINNKL